MSRSSEGCKLYIGNISFDTTERDLEKAFDRYGAITFVWVARKPPGFGFIEFEDSRDADDAVRDMNGRTFRGRTIRVEVSMNKRNNRNSDRSGSDRNDRRSFKSQQDYSPPRRRKSRSRSPRYR